MKVTFYSNFLTHHQVPFCLEMQKRLGDDFKFVSTVKIFQWRLDMGFKDLDQEYDFVIRAYEDDKQREKAKKLALDSDIVIICSTTDELIEERLKQDKITFRYRARIFIFLDGFFKTIFDKDIDELLEQKEKNERIELVWVARFIKWKHPEIVIKLAKNLKKQNYNFHIKMLGAGQLENKIKETIKKENLEDVIEVVGQVPSDRVKDYMEKANIFIGTSDSREGWGAVINESMNAACTVIANQKMGSVPFLIKHKENGLMYNRYNELEKNVKMVINDKKLRKELGKNAYKTITEDWTSEIAAKNLIELFENILNGKKNTVSIGPASNAKNYKKEKFL